MTSRAGGEAGRAWPPRLRADFDWDDEVDADDVRILIACLTGPEVLYEPLSLPATEGCTLTPAAHGKIAADFDEDGDVDQDDFGVFQRCHSGAGKPADPNCAGRSS